MTVRDQKFINKDIPVHIMAYVGEELYFHSFWLCTASNSISVQKQTMYEFACPHWYFKLYPHTSSIRVEFWMEIWQTWLLMGRL